MDKETNAEKPSGHDMSDDRTPLQGNYLDSIYSISASILNNKDWDQPHAITYFAAKLPSYDDVLKENEKKKKLLGQCEESYGGIGVTDANQSYIKMINTPLDWMTSNQRLLEYNTVIQETQQTVVNIESRVDTISETLENATKLDQERWQEVVNQNASRVQEHQDIKSKINNLQETVQGIQDMLMKGPGMMQAREVTYDEVEDPNDFEHGCRKCRCRRDCSCECHRHREMRNNKERKDIDTKDIKWQGARPKQFSKRIIFNDKNGQRRSRSLSRDNSDNSQTHRNHSGIYSDYRESSKERKGTKNLAGAAGGPPDDPNSGDSTNSDGGDNDEKKGDRNDRRRRGKNERKIIWSIDVEAWNICLKNECEESFNMEASTLLEAHKIPNGDLLNKVCTKIGRKSKTLLQVCNAICDYLKQKSENILEVWAGYWYKRNDAANYDKIVFAILTNDQQKFEDDNFAVYCRGLEEIKARDENVAIMRSEKENPQDTKELQELKRVQRESAPELMEKHKRLTRITVSWIKHTIGESLPSGIRKCLCIALYVHIRGLIPLEEEPFASLIEGHPVDVREGTITLCKGPYDYHNHLRMGCAISGSMSEGTLGPFIKFKGFDNEQYALTSAHVLFQGEYLKLLVDQGIIESFGDLSGVYQPPKFRPFGEVVRAIFKRGSDGNAGMEVALIKLHERFPNSGEFPDSQAEAFARIRPLRFSSGVVLPASALKTSTDVFKYGCKSKLTVGSYRTDGSSIRVRKLWTNETGFEIVMHDQIEIYDSYDMQFATPGDSGALVMVNTTGGMAAVGILEGIDTGNACYLVTPMDAILKTLESIGYRQSECYINNYPPYQTVSNTDLTDSSMDITEHNFVWLESKTDKIDTLEYKVSEVDKKLSARVNEIDEKCTRMEQAINRNEHTIAQHLQCFKTEISIELERQSKELERHRQEQERHSNTLSDIIKNTLVECMQQFANNLNTRTSSLINQGDVNSDR